MLSKKVADERIKMLADRLAILMVICNARDQDDWIPWALERSYDDDDSMGYHIRRMKDYEIAKSYVREWITSTDKKTTEKRHD